ncbi:MAG: FMN-binding protein [Eubacteriales bacterium]|nr:FMN-binding protein [Eubacteriales bacterium]
MAKRTALKDRGIMPALVLFVICLLATTCLAMTYELTAERRARLEQEALMANKQILFSTADEFKPVDYQALPSGHELELFEAAYANGELQGYLIQASVKGYGKLVPVLSAFDPEGQLLAILVGDNDETAGLGKRIEEDEFRAQFSEQSAFNYYYAKAQKNANPELEPLQIDAISGATISSEAVCEAVNIAAEAFRSLED